MIAVRAISNSSASDGRSSDSMIARRYASVVLKAQQLVDYEWCTAQRMEEGSNAHIAAHYAIEGDLYWPDAETIGVDGFARAALRFLEDYDAETLGVENVIYSSLYGFAGKYDWKGRLRRLHAKRIAMVDWKTSIDPAPANGLQLAGYVDGEFELTKERISSRFVVLLRRDGTYKGPIEYSDPDDFEQFRSAVRNYHWRKAHGVMQAEKHCSTCRCSDRREIRVRCERCRRETEVAA